MRYNEEYVDMIKAGILDPAKVTRSALQNATSVASTLLTTESVVGNIKEETPAMPAAPQGGMGMMLIKHRRRARMSRKQENHL